MTASTTVIGHRSSEVRDGRLLLHFEVHLPHGYEPVWSAVATGPGLRGWLARPEVLQRRLGGAVTLVWPGGPTVSGRITAWDVDHVAEYTLAGYGRMRFHLDAVGTDSTLVRFTNERAAVPDAERLDALAAWHEHFERLADALDGHPVDWITWTPARRAELRAYYAGS
ncbi:hypothetical protein LG634_29930 [Streptomyces bambusae]|uniref:hypothetical protein n=1 Tax=Streptomyces bambusae TaxID=1550616 RepID=UPI001CFE6C1C|nr:hypothetical protein [Streptomyces bambusae]MCB5169019.1 hypothetical protein [Streptomyces bambusae]